MCRNNKPPGISAKSLFHFTNTADNLINILRNEFHPNFCLEALSIIGEVTDDKNSAHAIPMICFCDLPISEIKEHLEFYGKYGLGFTKEWGKSKGICPVLYSYSGAPTCKYISNIAQFMLSINSNDDEISTQTFTNFLDLISYIKPYEGKIYRNGTYRYKRFYDEKEWRFVPKITDIKGFNEKGNQIRLSREEFNNPIMKAQSNSYIQSQIKLTFEPKDIKYIFVNKEDEILPMIDAIRDIKCKYDEATVKLLSSRIMTTDQIYEDF